MNALPVNGFMTKQLQKKAFGGGMKFQNDDVVIARITPCLENGKTALISLLNEDEIGFGSTEFIVIRGVNLKLKSFACCLSRSEKFRKHSISKMTGTSGRKRVKADALANYKMPIPSKKILENFEKTTSIFFDKMTVNTKENQKLSELRDWLLPMLMNGQVTIGEAEEELGMVAERNYNHRV
jgi:type I restriction enzyme S subunit